MQHMTSLQ